MLAELRAALAARRADRSGAPRIRSSRTANTFGALRAGRRWRAQLELGGMRCRTPAPLDALAAEYDARAPPR